MLISTWFPVHTGQQVYTAKLAEALSQEFGYEVDVLTRAIQGKLTAEQRKIETVPALRIKRFGFPSQPWNIFMQLAYMTWVFFRLLFAGKKYALYHAQGASAAAAMKAASWFTRVPTLVTVHGNHIFERSWTLKKVIHRIMFLETKFTQEVSIAENFLNAVNVNEHIAVVPYGVDTAPFDAVPLQRSRDQFNVIYVGRLDTQKGLDILLRATKKVIESNGFIQSHRDFMLHLVGSGPDRHSLEQLAKRLGIEKFVRFHGYLGTEALIGLYKSCDLFVLPSRTESLPLSVLEAAAARLPILATNTGDLRNVVLENVNGHLVESDDADELAYYLEYFAGNPHLETLGQGSYDLVSQEYSWDKSIHKMLRVYESIVSRQAAKHMKAHDHFPLWQLPHLLWAARKHKKTYKGKAPVRFCLTSNLVQFTMGDELPDENTEIPTFLERFSEFCAQLEAPSTLFIQAELLESLHKECLVLKEGGHELGVRVNEKDWITLPQRRSTLRALRDELSSLEMGDVRFLRVPLEPSEQDLEVIHEFGFETLPTSEDPWPRIEFHWGIPFGTVLKMNLKAFVEEDDEDLIEAIRRLAALQKENGVSPYIIFECDSTEFFSREELSHASGENFTRLAKKIAVLRETMSIEFCTLSDFCKSCNMDAKQ